MAAKRAAVAPSLLRQTARALGARSLVRAAYGVKRKFDDLSYELGARYLSTPRSERQFQAHRPTLTEAQRSAVHDLDTRGIAIVPARELLGAGQEEAVAAVEAKARAFRDSERVRKEAELYLAAQDFTGWKDYSITMLQGTNRLPWDDPMLRLALRSAMLDIVNSYLRLWSKLRSVNMWYTVPVPMRGPRTASQRWHRDPEDRRLVKAFLYVEEVDESAGPLEYIPGSRRGGPYAYLWPFATGGGVPNGSYPDQDQVEAAVPAHDRVTCTCPPATLVFVDTSGFHRGGYATGKGRLLGTWMFVTPASRAPRDFILDFSAAPAGLSPAAAYAVT
jgi:hypothetical protein